MCCTQLKIILKDDVLDYYQSEVSMLQAHWTRSLGQHVGIMFTLPVDNGDNQYMHQSLLYPVEAINLFIAFKRKVCDTDTICNY